MPHVEEFDVIIVGGGPAGLCAAMYAGRGMLKTVLLERGVPGGELLNTEWIDDYPGFEHILGRELAQRMTAHAVEFGADIRQENVEAISRREDGIFEVTTTGGTVYQAPAVILTAGGTPTKLEVPGELEYAGRGVSYCAVCDGAFFKGETIAVVGGGDAAVEEADYLTRYAEKVYVIHRRDEFRASQDAAGAAVRESQDRGDLEQARARVRRHAGGSPVARARGHGHRRAVDARAPPAASSSSASGPTPGWSSSTSRTTPAAT